MLPTASRLKSHLPKILLRRGRIFCLVPCLCSADALYKAPLATGSQDPCSCNQALWRSRLGPSPFFAAALLTPYKPSLTIKKKPGSAFCVGMSPERPLAPKSYCATVGFFCLPSAPIFKKFLCQGKRSQLRKKVTSTEKSYCAAVGIFACVLLKLYKAPFPAGKKPGRSCCAAKPPEDAACSGILLRRGRKFLPVPCSRLTSHPSP